MNRKLFMKTSWFGSYIVPVLACLLCAAAGFAGATALHLKEKKDAEEKMFFLEKEHWHCFVGVLFETGFECFSYKRKDADFGKFSGPRRGDDNLPKGKPVQQM